MLGVALCATDCISDTQRSGKTPTLPFELVEHIVDCVIQRGRETRTGATAAVLLHVSSQIRFRVVNAFTPINIYETDGPQYDQDVRVHFLSKSSPMCGAPFVGT